MKLTDDEKIGLVQAFVEEDEYHCDNESAKE